MKKILLLWLLIGTTLFSGCAKGHITLAVTRLGAADLTCELVGAPILKPTVDSFQEDFKQDGYAVSPAKEGDFTGFRAQKHYNQIKDIKDSKVLRTFDFNTWEDAANKAIQSPAPAQGGQPGQKAPAKKPEKKEAPIVKLSGGLLFDTISVHTAVDMGDGKHLKEKDAQAILQNILSQVDLRFTLVLPTGADSTNAGEVSPDKKVLTWRLPLGQKTPLEATVTYLNPIKAAGWLLVLVVVGGVGNAYWRKRQRLKKWREQNPDLT